MNEISPDISVILPCLNEEKTLGQVIEDAYKGIEKTGMKGEVIVIDNGSTDDSLEVAERIGVRTAFVSEKGYGNVIREGILQARGQYIVMADSDCSYNLLELPLLIKSLQDGNDLVIGNRFKGIQKGAMPWLHRYIGTPVISWLGRMMYDNKVRDYNSGFRACKKEKIEKLALESTGFELASEMIIKAAKAGLKIVEVPVTLSHHVKGRRSHLHPIRDGLRHFRVLLSNR